MTAPSPVAPFPEVRAPRRFPPNVIILGYVSMLTAMSSAMIYGLLPVFLVKALGVSIGSVGLIEGVAEAGTSLVKIASGAVSDRIGRRKPVVVFGYTLSAVTKTVFPMAGTVFSVLAARVIDRMGKGIRDAPRDAFHVEGCRQPLSTNQRGRKPIPAPKFDVIQFIESTGKKQTESSEMRSLSKGR
jgi:MFS transporter